MGKKNLIKNAKRFIESYLTSYNGEGMSAVHPILNLTTWAAEIELAINNKNQEKLRELLEIGVNYLERAEAHFNRHFEAIKAHGGTPMQLKSAEHNIVELKATFKLLEELI